MIVESGCGEMVWGEGSSEREGCGEGGGVLGAAMAIGAGWIAGIVDEYGHIAYHTK